MPAGILRSGIISYSLMEKLKSGADKLGLHLTAEVLEQFEVYYRELVDWNRRVNLTSITGYEEVQVKHFLDALTVTLAMEFPAANERLNVIDVGTGAGLPGIPLKILLPDIRLVLLEATARKAGFLQHLATVLGLDNVEIIVGRAEEVAKDSGHREAFDLVLSRAVAPLPTLAELTLPFCAVGGRFIAQKKGDINKEVESSSRAIEVMGGRLGEVKAVDVPRLRDNRWLVVIDKVMPTPLRYPRRPGMPAKRPLL